MANTNLLKKEYIDLIEIKKQLKSYLEYEINYVPKVSSKNNSQKNKSIQYFIKRFIDVSGTCIGLIIISPLLIAIAAAIKLESKGPILFKQKRIGENGKNFYMYKFRSMYENSENKLKYLKKYNQTNDYMFKMLDDPRITKVGKFIRKYSLDELAQLINVLRGEMALVGFRPPLPGEVVQYKDWHHLRFSGIPGLTGPWQVGGRSDIKNFDDVVKLEWNYYKNWNILKDIKILFKTIPIVIFGKNAA